MDEKYVLLVEDNPDDVILAEMAFKRGKISNRLAVVRDGREALDFLFGQGKYADGNLNGKPGLVLLDLKLPLVSGLDVLKEIRADKICALIPVIVLTSSLDANDQAESLRLGASDYIRKPLSFSHFVEIIQQISAKWLS